MKNKLKIILSLIFFLAVINNASAAPMRDFFNRNINIPASPKRIVSLSPATTELLCALDLNDRIIGVTSDCNFPPGIKNKAKVGKFGFIDIEKLIALHPDMIICPKDMEIKLYDLKKIKVPLLAISNPNLKSIIDNVILLGKITGKEKKALMVAQTLIQKLKNIKKRPHPVTGYYLLWYDPMITASENSFIGDIIKRADIVNIVGKTKSSYLHYNMETLLKKNPDIIIIPKKIRGTFNLKKAPFNMLKAVKTNRVLVIDDDIISRPGPRSFDALIQIANF